MKFSNNEIFQAYKIISQYIIDSTYITEADLDEKDHESIERLLAYFEFICVGYRNGDINKKIVEMQIKSGIRDTYRYSWVQLSTARNRKQLIVIIC